MTSAGQLSIRIQSKKVLPALQDSIKNELAAAHKILPSGFSPPPARCLQKPSSWNLPMYLNFFKKSLSSLSQTRFC